MTIPSASPIRPRCCSAEDLRIGYPRAARVMDELEDQGVVGTPEGGSGSRPVLLGDDAPEAEPVASGREGDA